MINETIVRSVLSPFGAVPRQAGYLTNPRYSFYREENKELDRYGSLQSIA